MSDDRIEPRLGRVTRRTALVGSVGAIALGADAAAQSMPRIPSFGGLLRGQNQPEQQAEETAEETLATAGAQSWSWLGYSQNFQSVRSYLATGDYSSAIALYEGGTQTEPDPTAQTEDPEEPDRLFSSRDTFLSNVELGMMSFDFKQWQPSTDRFSAAHDYVLQGQSGENGGGWFARQRRRASGLLRRGGAFLIGRDEFAPYTQRDYERILQLNYLALSFLVPGDRRAYNVNRIAIEEQDLARREFEEEIAEATQRRQEAESDATVGRAAGDTGNLFMQVLEQFTSISGRVPSAYVNPIGFYLSGVIQEIASNDRPALRGNARNSYQAALDLAGSSSQLSDAVIAMQSPPAEGERILHVLIGEGFAPSRQALLFGVNRGDRILPIRIPVFRPNESSVTHMEVADARGQPLLRLDAIGDIEALVMRAQQDRAAQWILGIVASTLRSDAEQRLAARFGEVGSAVMQFKQSYDSPDTRSWSSLPARFHIGRLRLRSTDRALRIRAYSNRRVIQDHTVTVDPALSQSVIYGRASDTTLGIEEPRRLWIDGIDEA